MLAIGIGRCAVIGGLFMTAAAMGRPHAGDGIRDLDAGPFGGYVHEAVSLANTDARVVSFGNEHRVLRLYGDAFSTGVTPEASAASFLAAHSGIFNAEAADLVPAPREDGDGHTVGVMYDRDTGSYEFTALYYRQVRDGVPVFGSRVVLLVRNEPGYPLVLVNPDVRDLGDFQLAAGHAEVVPNVSVADVARANFGIEADRFDAAPRVESTRRVIYAGVGDAMRAPVLADDSTISIGPDLWRLVTDAATGAILHDEQLICFQSITGTVTGMATEGIGAEQCEDEVPVPLPHLTVSVPIGGVITTTDAEGSYALTPPFGGFQLVRAGLRGTWFDVFDFFGNNEILTSNVIVPAQVDFVFNGENQESERAQVNGYLQANVVRDFVLRYNPDYPTLQEGDFPVWVNRNDGFCPANAWYSPQETTINFCQADGSSPNTAWSSVIHHEYGHHLVRAAGSGQGAYGEGTGDVISTLTLDSPALGLGFSGNCDESLRTADNSCQYLVAGCSTCGSAIHACGQLLSGCVWDTRNQLFVSNPSTYIDIIAGLAINAILIHTGSSIDPSITIDYLTLDDDNGTIFDGTPHYQEISTGFGLHGMGAPELLAVEFVFPDGLPEVVGDGGETTVRVQVNGVIDSPEPGTGRMLLDDGDGFESIAMTEIVPNLYDATFPASACAHEISYYFSTETVTGATAVWPTSAPERVFTAIVADASDSLVLDDFETDTGWEIGGVVGDGPWERGVPIGGGDRGDPPTDYDGSGQCYVTDNVAGNSDVDGGITILTSPTYDASGDDTFVRYARWYSNTFGSNPMSDIFEVEVSDDDGDTWTSLEVVGPDGPEVSGGWFKRSFRIADFVTPNDQFRIQFKASDLGEGSVVEAGVDAVEVVRFICLEPCTGDLDGSGDVGFADVLRALAVWGSCTSCAEDLNGDGLVDFRDIQALMNAWGACPGGGGPPPTVIPAPAVIPAPTVTPAQAGIQSAVRE